MKGNPISSMLNTIKQWLSGPVPTVRQRVYMRELSRKRKKRLASLSEPLLCITVKQSKSKLPANAQWQLLPESTTPPQAIYAKARRLIDDQTDTIKAYLPDFFKNAELQLDYEPIHKMNRQQMLAITGLPFLSSCFESFVNAQATANLASASEATLAALKPIIMDSPITPGLLSEKMLAEQQFPAFTALFSPVDPLSPQDFKRRRSALKTPAFDKPTVLLVMSAPVHFKLAQAALETLANAYTVVIYFASAEKVDAELRQTLSQQYFTIDGSTLMPDERLIRNACNYFNRRMLQIANLEVPATLREALLSELDQMGNTIHIMCLLETVLTHIRPVAVMGCMEKNRMSIAFKMLRERYKFKLMNFQHGIMPLTHNMDWQHFDRFFVWNPLTRNVLLKDGYAHPDSIAIVGNPFWANTQKANQSALSPKAQEIADWRGDSLMIGAYTQYASGYVTPELRRTYLKAHPHVKLLIKKHPLETDHLVEEMLAQTQLQERVMLCAGRELDLWESFSLIDFSTTICSTALLDSLQVKVPAMALDFTDIIADIGYGYEEEPGITIIRQPQDIAPLFDQLLTRNTQRETSVQTTPDTAAPSLVYPNLPGTYAERIQQSLMELGLLQASSPDSNG